MELSGPGVQYIADNQLYNSIITAHAILMIFFMVKKINIFNYKFESCCVSSVLLKGEDKEKTININNDNNNNLIIGCSVQDNNNKNNKNFKDSKDQYVKILVNDPFNNRDIILKVTASPPKATKRCNSNIIFIRDTYCIYIIFSSK